MKVSVLNLWTGHIQDFVGDEYTIVDDLLIAYRHIVADKIGFRPPTLDLVTRVLARQQSLDVAISHDDILKSENNAIDIGENSEVVQDMLGYRPEMEAALEAAKFLAGGRPVSLDNARRFLWHSDGDACTAALNIYGLDLTEENRKALESIMQIQALKKSESGPGLSTDADIRPFAPEAVHFADAIRRAAKAGLVLPIKLGGKHSAGSMIAKDPETESSYILKPGAGKSSPASGIQEDSASQSEREAAFYAVAERLGLQSSIPECRLVLIDGKEVAVIKLLGWEYKNLEKRRQQDASLPAKTLESYRQSGILHKWAVLDFILGNTDRHAQNIMANGVGDLKLIDHGSAFAGNSFDPAYDKNSFIPYYLRYSAPSDKSFNLLNLKEKMRFMPHAPENVRPALLNWILSIHPSALSTVILEYRIAPEPMLHRLAKLQKMCNSESPDICINRLWAGT